jgi:hypothetical protein
MTARLDARFGREDASGLFALARRILSGGEATPEAPVEPIDMKNGIGRALRHVKSARQTTRSAAEKAALAIAVVEGTLVATDAVDAALSEMQDVVSHALAAQEPEARLLCAQRFANLIERIDTIVAGAVFDGVNLIDLGRGSIDLVSPIGSQPRHAIGHIVLVTGERGLNLKAPSQGFVADAEIEATGHALTRARARLIKAADTFLNQASCLAPLLGHEMAA